MNRFQIPKNLLVDLRQLLIQPYDPPVGFPLIAFLPVRTVGTVFTDIQLFRSAVPVSANMDIRVMRKCLPVGTDQLTFFSSLEIHSTEGIFSVSSVPDGLVVHGKFHVLLHAVLFAIQIIVERAVTCIRNRILWINAIYCIELCSELFIDLDTVFQAGLLPDPGVPIGICLDFCSVDVCMGDIHAFFSVVISTGREYNTPR